MNSTKSLFHRRNRRGLASDGPGGDFNPFPDPRPDHGKTAGLDIEPPKLKPLPLTPLDQTQPPQSQAFRTPRSKDPNPRSNPRPDPEPRPPVPKEMAYIPKRPIVADNWNEEKGRPYRPGGLRPKMDPLHGWTVEGEHRRTRVRSIEMGPRIYLNWRSLVRPTRN